MAKGEFSRAFNFNLIGPGLFITFVIVWFFALLRLIGVNGPFDRVINLLYNTRFVKAALASIAFYWAARIIYLLATEGYSSTIGRGLLARLLD